MSEVFDSYVFGAETRWTSRDGVTWFEEGTPEYAAIAEENRQKLLALRAAGILPVCVHLVNAKTGVISIGDEEDVP